MNVFRFSDMVSNFSRHLTVKIGTLDRDPGSRQPTVSVLRTVDWLSAVDGGCTTGAIYY